MSTPRGFIPYLHNTAVYRDPEPQGNGREGWASAFFAGVIMHTPRPYNRGRNMPAGQVFAGPVVNDPADLRYGLGLTGHARQRGQGTMI